MITLLSTVYPQTRENDYGNDKERDKVEHKHAKNEIGFVAGPVSFPSEIELSAGFHMHYLRAVGHQERFGLGLGIGLGTILDEHSHYTSSFIIKYRIYKGLIIGYAPGILLISEESDSEFQFTQHIELLYGFEVGNIHLGPVAELGIESEGLHYLLGIHIGFGF